MQKHAVFIKWAAAASAAVLAVNVFLDTAVLRPYLKKFAFTCAVEKLKVAAAGRATQFARALDEGDDLTIIRSIKEMMNDSDFSYVRILSTGGIVLAGGAAQAETGPACDPASRRACKSDNELLQTLKDPPAFDYSIPLVSDGRRIANLSIGMPLVNALKNRFPESVLFRFLPLLLTVVLIAPCVIVFRIVVGRRLKALRSSLENVLAGPPGERLSADSGDEIGSIAKIVNRILDRQRFG
jgi:methyl-accepting chemotaxis protein